ncbi:YSIRK-type signal peptide-containing protein, partial [Streptococcus sciuri]
MFRKYHGKHERQRFSLRKLSVGTASVFLGTLVFLGTSTSASAEDVQVSTDTTQATRLEKSASSSSDVSNVDSTASTNQAITDTEKATVASEQDSSEKSSSSSTVSEENAKSTDSSTVQEDSTRVTEQTAPAESQTEASTETEQVEDQGVSASQVVSSDDKSASADSVSVTSVSNTSSSATVGADLAPASTIGSQSTQTNQESATSDKDAKTEQVTPTEEKPTEKLVANETQATAAAVLEANQVATDDSSSSRRRSRRSLSDSSTTLIDMRDANNNNNNNIGDIVSSNPKVISTEGFALGDIPTPELRSEASGYQYWAYDTDPSHYVIAVVENFRGGKPIGDPANKVGDGSDADYVYTFSLATDKTNPGTIYVEFYGKQKQWLGETVVKEGETQKNGGFTFRNENQSIAWAVSGNKIIGGDTLYTWKRAQSHYSGKGQFVGDTYPIPTKVTSTVQYVDQSGSEIGTVSITGLSGQKYTAPLKTTITTDSGGQLTSAPAKATGGLTVTSSGTELLGQLSNWHIGYTYTNDLSGRTYVAVPGVESDYYTVLPSRNSDGTWDETSAELKDPSEVKPSLASDGLVAVTARGANGGDPAYIPMSETAYRYMGTVSNGGTTASQYVDNPFSGGTAAPVYVFTTITNKTVPTSQTVTFEGAGDATPATDTQNDYSFSGKHDEVTGSDT